MDKEYFFHCSGCKKPDKEYPMNFDDYEYGEPVYNTPKVSEHISVLLSLLDNAGNVVIKLSHLGQTSYDCQVPFSSLYIFLFLFIVILHFFLYN